MIIDWVNQLNKPIKSDNEIVLMANEVYADSCLFFFKNAVKSTFLLTNAMSV